MICFAGKATGKGGKPQGQWALLKSGWQNKAVALCGASEWQQETVAFSGFEKFGEFFMNNILRLTSCRTMSGATISSRSCLAIGSVKKQTWSLRAMIFFFIAPWSASS